MAVNLSASTWNYLCAYGDEADLPLAIGEICDAGFGVELWINWWAEPEAVAVDQWPELVKMLDGCRVSAHSALSGWDEEAFRTEVKMAQYLGASVLVVHAGALGMAEDGDGDSDLDRCSFAAEYARSEGVTVALENTPYPGNTEMVRAAIGAAPDLRVCIDLAHAHIVRQEPAEMIKQFGRKVVHIHVSDNGGEEDEHLTPGDGDIPEQIWERAFRALADMDNSGQIVMEIRSTEPKSEAQRGARFVRNVAAAAGLT